MKRTAPHSDAVRLIRFAGILWIGYLVVLALISETLSPPTRPGEPPQGTQSIYYVFFGAIALVCVGLAYWPWIQKRLREAFIPVIIAIITVMPVLVNWAFFPMRPQSGVEDPILRPLPFLFVGLLLVAWQYKWHYILIIILGIAGLNLGMVWSVSPPGTLPFMGTLVVTLVQTVIFLALGFSVSFLMNRLRQQQQSLESANIRLTHYASTLESLATSRERNRLARELHDTLAHTLSGLSVQLEAIKAYWDIDRQTARSTLDKSSEAAHSGLDETRRALKALRASPLDDLGLSLALSAMVKDLTARSDVILELSIVDKIPSLSPDVEQCVYRVAQEAVTNAMHHANAKNLMLRLEYIDGKVTLTVRDDGMGFELEKISKTGHFGLTGMRERALLVGGELHVISKPGHGTTIRLII